VPSLVDYCEDPPHEEEECRCAEDHRSYLDRRMPPKREIYRPAETHFHRHQAECCQTHRKKENRNA
jgi:hypothetical protein